MSQRIGTNVDLYVVIADDDIEDHKLITRAVTDCDLNHIVSSVYNGSQLMNLLQKKEFYKSDNMRLPDLIILDLQMPIMNGFEVLEEIKNRNEFKGIPIFVLSDSIDDLDETKAVTLGAKKFFTKPYSYTEIKSIMKGICEEAKEGKRPGS